MDEATTTDRGREGHDGHDQLLIAGLLDRDLSEVDRSIAERLVAICGECAALHADLVDLAKATTELLAAARTRDFRLTADDAARLGTADAGEPRGGTARLTGDMHFPPDHAMHDGLLIASLLDRSLEDS